MSIWNDPAVDEFIVANRAAGETYEQIANLLLAHFGLTVTGDQVSGRYSRIKGGVVPVRRGPSLPQVKKNLLKAVRSAVRLRHAIEADNELEQVIPKVEAFIDAQLQSGRVDALSLRDLLDLIDE